jgi:hypothetical protein
MARSKKTPAKSPKSEAAKPARRKDGKGSIVYFMGQLIAAGYLGEELPESAKDQQHAAMRVRQMAEKLARQTRKFGDEDVVPGGDSAASEPEEEEDE